MNEHPIERCPECEELDRRDFIRVVGTTAALAATGLTLPAIAADTKPEAKTVTKPTKPAEDLIKELHANLSDDQKKSVMLPWDDKARMGMYNSALNKQTIGKIYTKAQQELINRIVRSVVSGE